TPRPERPSPSRGASAPPLFAAPETSMRTAVHLRRSPPPARGADLGSSQTASGETWRYTTASTMIPHRRRATDRPTLLPHLGCPSVLYRADGCPAGSGGGRRRWRGLRRPPLALPRQAVKRCTAAAPP